MSPSSACQPGATQSRLAGARNPNPVRLGTGEVTRGSGAAEIDTLIRGQARGRAFGTRPGADDSGVVQPGARPFNPSDPT